MKILVLALAFITSSAFASSERENCFNDLKTIGGTTVAATLCHAVTSSGQLAVVKKCFTDHSGSGYPTAATLCQWVTREAEVSLVDSCFNRTKKLGNENAAILCQWAKSEADIAKVISCASSNKNKIGFAPASIFCQTPQ